jgi:hypothetical protein
MLGRPEVVVLWCQEGCYGEEALREPIMPACRLSQRCTRRRGTGPGRSSGCILRPRFFELVCSHLLCAGPSPRVLMEDLMVLWAFDPKALLRYALPDPVLMVVALDRHVGGRW